MPKTDTITIDDLDAAIAGEAPQPAGGKKPSRSTGESVAHYAKHGYAGLLEMLNLPALYTLPGVVGSFTESDEEAAARAQTGEPPPYALPGHNTAQEWATNISDSINNVVGVEDPQGIGENAARLITALAPARWPGAAKQVATQAAKNPSVLSKIARGAGHVGNAVVVPGVQGKYTPVTAGANFGIPFALQQGVTEAIETPEQPEHTVIDHLPGTEKTVPMEGEIIPPDMPILDLDAELSRRGNFINDLDGTLLSEMDEADKEESSWRKGMIAAGAAAAAYFGARHMRQKMLEKVDQRSAMPSLTEPAPSENIATTGELAKGGIFDEMEPARSQLEKATGDADLFSAQAQLGNQVGVAAQSAEAFSTGRFPVLMGAGDQKPIRVQPLKDILFAADQLPPAQRSAIDDVLLAMDEIDQMRLAKATPTDTSLLKGKTLKELQDLVRVHMQDPQTRALVTAFQEQPKAVLRFVQQSGLISAEQVKKWGGNHPHYMPREQYEAQRLRDLLMGPKESNDAVDALDNFAKGQRSVELEGRGTEFKGTFMPPTTVLANEQRRAIRAAQVNNTRRLFFQNLRNEDGTYKLKGVYEVAPERAGEKNVIKYYVNGRPQYWKVKDQSIYTALKNAGNSRQLDGILGVANVMRQAKQFAITGPVVNPKFQVISGQLWDPVWASIVAPKGTSFGGIKAPAVGVIGAVKGFRAHHKARMAEFFRQEALLRSTNLSRRGVSYKTPISYIFQKVADKMPQERLEQLADSYAEAYAQTPVALYRMMGGSGARVWNDYEQLANLNIMDPAARRKWVEAFKGAFDNEFKADLISGRNLSQEHGWLGYYARGLVDTLHQGTRYQLLDINKPTKGNLLKDASLMEDYINDLAKVARNQRDLLDTSRHGGTTGKVGATATTATATLPYANVMLQGFYKLGKAWKNNPERVTKAVGSIAMAGAAGAYLNSRWSDAHREWFWNELSPEQRAGALWIPNPMSEDPHDSIRIPLEPTTAAIAMIGQNLMDASFGISSGQVDPRILQNLDHYFNYEDQYGMTTFDRRATDVASGGRRLFGLGLPPALEAGAPAAGMRFNMEGQLVPLYGQQVQQYNDMLGNVPTRYVDGIISSQNEAIMNGLMGPIATGIVVDMVEGAKMQLDKEPWGLMNAMGEMKDQYIDRVVGPDKTPIRPYTVEARELKDYERAIDDIETKWSDAMRRGQTRQQRGVALSGRIAPGFDDPMQQQLFQTVRPQVQRLRSTYRDRPGGISDLLKERDSIMSDPRRTLAERKQEENQLNLRIQQLQNEYLSALQLIESDIAEQLGVEDFDLRDWADNRFKIEQ